MYSAIPGFAHLKLFVPQDRVIYSRPAHATDIHTRKLTNRLVCLAVEVAAGKRSILHLSHKHFHPTIKLHLGTWMRTNGVNSANDAKVQSLHIRPNGEYFGTALIGDKQHAFTGAIDEDKLESFRLL